MKKKKENSKNSSFKKIHKHLKDFMLDEDGFASKEKMLKLGIGTVAALGIFSELYHDISFAAHTSGKMHKKFFTKSTTTSTYTTVPHSNY